MLVPGRGVLRVLFAPFGTAGKRAPLAIALHVQGVVPAGSRRRRTVLEYRERGSVSIAAVVGSGCTCAIASATRCVAARRNAARFLARPLLPLPHLFLSELGAKLATVAALGRIVGKQVAFSSFLVPHSAHLTPLKLSAVPFEGIDRLRFHPNPAIEYVDRELKLLALLCHSRPGLVKQRVPLPDFVLVQELEDVEG